MPLDDIPGSGFQTRLRREISGEVGEDHQCGEQQPKDVVSRMDKAVRKGKVFIDWSQNDEHKTTVAVYSLRARERPAVSTPLTWDEVEEAAATGDASRLDFDAAAVLARVDDRGDLYAPVAELEQDLPASPR